MTVLPVGGTELSQLVTAVVNGTSIGVFDTLTGGDSVAPGAQYRSGGMGIQVSYTTLPKFSDIKITRVLDESVDWELIRTLKQQAGRVAGSVTVQPLDSDGNSYGNSQTSQGMFLGVGSIKVDSNSDTIQTYELTFSVDSWS
jgi:hypothetical protein